MKRPFLLRTAFLTLCLAALPWAVGATPATQRVKGVINHVHADHFDDGTAQDSWSLTTDSGQELDLHIPPGTAESAALRPGAHVSIQGLQLGNQLMLQSDPSATAIAPTGTITPLVQSTGPSKVAVILFNFGRNNTSQPWTPDYVRGVIFTNPSSVNAWYKEVSYGKKSLTGLTRPDGDIYGWYTIDYDSSAGCNYTTWAAAARTKAEQDGFVLSNYDQVVFATPKTSACSWSGMANVSGKNSYINGYMTVQVVSHEMGHNFGLLHASAYICRDANQVRVSISTSCSVSEYGDPYAVMGSSTNHFHSMEKASLSYLTLANQQTVTSSGTYTLLPHEQSGIGVMMIRVPRTRDATGKVTQYYYLEYRQPYGYDNFTATSPAVNGVTIRLGGEFGYYNSTHTMLIDTTPETSSFRDAPLATGKTFTDPITQISITTVSTSSSSVAVQINIPGA